MSLRHVVVSDNAVDIYTDTLIYDASGKPAGLCEVKCFGAGVVPFAIAIRGKRLPALEGTVTLQPLFDLDEAQHFACSGGLPFGDYELTLAGWSPARARVVAVELRIRSGRVTASTDLPPGVHLAPTVNGLKLPGYLDEARMIRVAMATQRAAAMNGVGICIGGVLHRTSVTGNAVNTRIIGTFPDYPMDAARFDCPNARFLGERVAA